MFKTIVGPDGKVLEINNIGYPDYPIVPAKPDTYTKEEVITMFEEIKAEIKEKEKEYLHYFFIDLDAQDKTEHEKIIDIIDQKIERLKG